MANSKSQSLTTPASPALPFADFDRFFNRMMRGWPFTWPEFATMPRPLAMFEHMPKVEVKENDKSYNLTVELPGLDEKDVKVEVEGDEITISGEKKVEHTDEKTHFSERSYGSFVRSFTLPDNTDPNSIKAQFAKGVLSLEIAKTAGKPASGAKQVPIAKG